jgi:flavin reductase (DIM6/NTAB) family NADH-FMN oxidoreductase RutF
VYLGRGWALGCPVPAFTSQQLRRALGAFATGVTVVTTDGPGGAYGVTANSFTSVSLEPPLVLVCLRRRSPGRAAIAANGAFAINVLSAEQEALGRRFASRDRGRDMFAGIGHRPGRTGAPILAGGAHLECRLAGLHAAGDHVVVVGHVLDLGVDPEAEPLLFHAGRFVSGAPAAAL